MAKLSVVILAFNEEKKIKETLESVKFADEIIVIDSSSTDRTVEIAKELGVKVFTRINNLMLNVNKNFGFTKATGDWILSLDADEKVTKELREEIEEKLKEDNEINGYYIPRKNIIFGKWIEHTGWYPDHQLRLFKRGKGRFAEEHVHEMLSVDGATAYLLSPMEHANYETIAQFVNKTAFIYAPNEAEQLLKNGYKFSWTDCFSFPLKEFLSRFFAREGYKDGFHGLMLSLLMAFYHLIVFANLWEMKKFDQVNDINILEESEKEMKKAHQELRYWFVKEKIDSSRNILVKTKLKISRILNK